MPVDEGDPLVAPFLTYMRRMIGSQDPDAVTSSRHARTFSAGTLVGLTVGDLTFRDRRRIRRRTTLTQQFAGGAQLGSLESVSMAIYDHWNRDWVAPKPPSFDVLAIVTTYNEGDIIGGLLTRLRSQGIRVHVIDNWSSDESYEVVSEFIPQGGVTLERFPAEGSSEFFDWERILQRVEVVAHNSGADWVIHHDADEIRESPWPDVDLPTAMWIVDQWGYNCIDHTVVDFRPVDESWQQGGDLIIAFPWFEFGNHGAHFTQLRAWKPEPAPAALAPSGGHEATFDGRRVFPYKFINRHYSIRSQAHGERKVLRERHGRWSPTERERGWHTHYDHFDTGSSFIWDAADLLRWEEVDHRFLLQRLTGAGLPGNPNPGEGPTPT